MTAESLLLSIVQASQRERQSYRRAKDARFDYLTNHSTDVATHLELRAAMRKTEATLASHRKETDRRVREAKKYLESNPNQQVA